jgi:hypothetical protein
LLQLKNGGNSLKRVAGNLQKIADDGKCDGTIPFF